MGIERKDQPSEPRPLFSLGQVVSTPGALEALTEAGQDPLGLLARHITGNWGDLDEQDQAENNLSLQHNLRLLSAYTLPTGAKIWLITEADRSATTFLLPQEY